MIRIITFFVLLILVACKTTPPENNQTLAKKNKEEIKFIQIEGEINPDTPEFSGSLSSKIDIGGKDSIRMQVYGMFGIEVARIFANKNEFLAYNVFQGEAFKGEPSPEALEKVANINLNFDDLISFTRCEPPGNPDSYKFDKKLDGDLSLYRSNQKGNYLEFITLDKDGNMTQYQQMDKSGEAQLNVFFEDYKNHGGYMFAEMVTIKFPGEESKISIIGKKYSFPETVEDFSIDIPNEIEIRELAK